MRNRDGVSKKSVVPLKVARNPQRQDDPVKQGRVLGTALMGTPKKNQPRVQVQIQNLLGRRDRLEERSWQRHESLCGGEVVTLCKAGTNPLQTVQSCGGGRQGSDASRLGVHPKGQEPSARRPQIPEPSIEPSPHRSLDDVGSLPTTNPGGMQHEVPVLASKPRPPAGTGPARARRRNCGQVNRAPDKCFPPGSCGVSLDDPGCTVGMVLHITKVAQSGPQRPAA